MLYRLVFVSLFVFSVAITTVWGQTIFPNASSPSPAIGLDPSRPLSMPSAFGGASQGADFIPMSSGMLGAYMPTIPNLELGFQYFFGNRVRSGQISSDYLLPYDLGKDTVLFGEAHGNWWNFTKRPTGGASNRVDLSFGGGFRSILADQLLLGVNGFYDTSRLFNNWYSSGSVGLEMAANVGTNDAVDLNANWYGNIFSSTDILNAFRNKGGSYDIEAGYSHALFDNSLDLRLKFAGYQFDTGSSVYGLKTGADLTTKDGMFMLRYEYGSDRINGQWNNIGAFVNIGFQIENIIRGESPFTAPEPVFKSPRNLRRMLSQKVKRDWNQQYAPGRAALAAAAVVNGGGEIVCREVIGEIVLDMDQPLNFTPVDYQMLAPGAYVIVTFDYTNTGATVVDKLIAVGANPWADPVGANMTYVGGVTDQPATLALTTSTQSTFEHNPATVSFSFASANVTVKNIRVCFTYN